MIGIGVIAGIVGYFAGPAIVGLVTGSARTTAVVVGGSAVAGGPVVARSAASSRALGKALEAAGHVRPVGSAAHHIVAGGAKKAAPARAVLARFGVGINEAYNGVFLPAAIHARVHTNAYYEAVNSALSQATNRAQVEQTLNVIQQTLQHKGSFP